MPKAIQPSFDSYKHTLFTHMDSLVDTINNQRAEYARNIYDLRHQGPTTLEDCEVFY
jgi:hypothetical protein